MSDADPRREGLSLAGGELRPLLEAVRLYGDAHPGVIQQIWFEHMPDRVVALIGGGDVEAHEGALRALASVPEHLDVKRSAWPDGYLDQVRTEIWGRLQGSLSGIGQGKGVLHVHLWADQIDVAANLRKRFGAAVELEVGNFPYPDIASGDRHLAADQEPPALPALPDLVTLTISSGTEIRSGSHVYSRLMIENDTTSDLVAGKLLPPVVDPASGQVVGCYEGAITLERRLDRVPAGTSREVQIIIGTASTRPEVGYAVPPGHWALRLSFELGGNAFQRLIPLTVVP
ncbi:MAG TPA: hypothetical protein VMF35_00300 [Acidimicrobiales bacterium]|nr:hypothetical protein [Acidimicrobiales bacterium]